MKQKPEISFIINGETVKREEVIGMELERARKAAKRLGVDFDTDNISGIRRELVKRKIELGHDEIKRLCTNDVSKAKKVVGLMRILSRGRVKPCKVEVFAKGITAKEFVDWFEHINAITDEASLLAAHPEHYIINNTPGGRQEIYETNGGSPFTANFTIDFSDKEDALKQSIAGYPYHISGKAINEKGQKVGGSMHQFQDTEDGLHGLLSIDFPAITPPAIMNGHKYHLAIEFSNWIEMAYEGK